jgi:NOL1/NOP2/sun family putative RNA methylase
MPNHDEIIFKEKFKEHYSKLTDWEEFKKYSLSFLRRSIRVNTIKISVEELKKRLEDRWLLTPIPWCKEGFWIEDKSEEKRRDIGNLKEHTLGYFYIQEAASMIPPIVLEPKPGELVLDLCASPGSKTTQIAQYMQNKGILISNDYTPIRMVPLSTNVQRMGATNVIVTLMQGKWFKDFQFDRVLVDAPCSGTGTVRKSLKTLLIWNPRMTVCFAREQKKLIETGFNNLKKGGVLVYSTCSLEPEEDEEVVSFLLDKHTDAKIEEINLDGLKRSPAVLEFNGEKYNPEVRHCLRLWPQDNDTEGFFVAKIKKLEQ